MNKTILIIGASSGIGLALTKKLSLEGYNTIGTCRSSDRFPDINGSSFQEWDATDSGATLDLPNQIDGLVYCPGTISLKPFAKFSDQNFERDWTVNFLGAVRVIRQALPALKKSENPSMVLFSTVAVQTGLAYHASIASAKGAIEGLTRSLAAELAPRVRVNGIAPSLTDTPLAAGLLSNPEKAEASANRHPLKRVGNADETAALVQFLLSEDAGFISGQIIQSDGGMSSLRML